MLPAGGSNQHFPTAFHHAPLDFFSLELPRAIDHQGITQIHKLLTHGSIDTLTGSLITISLEQAQLEVRIGRSIFEADFFKYSFLATDCWIKSLWQFVSSHDILL